jgi:hypothetical protein
MVYRVEGVRSEVRCDYVLIVGYIGSSFAYFLPIEGPTPRTLLCPRLLIANLESGKRHTEYLRPCADETAQVFSHQRCNAHLQTYVSLGKDSYHPDILTGNMKIFRCER